MAIIYLITLSFIYHDITNSTCLQALLTNDLFFIFYCMYNLGVGGEVVKVVILIFGVSSEGLVGS